MVFMDQENIEEEITIHDIIHTPLGCNEPYHVYVFEQYGYLAFIRPLKDNQCIEFLIFNKGEYTRLVYIKDGDRYRFDGGNSLSECIVSLLEDNSMHYLIYMCYEEVFTESYQSIRDSFIIKNLVKFYPQDYNTLYLSYDVWRTGTFDSDEETAYMNCDAYFKVKNGIVYIKVADVHSGETYNITCIKDKIYLKSTNGLELCMVIEVGEYDTMEDYIDMCINSAFDHITNELKKNEVSYFNNSILSIFRGNKFIIGNFYEVRRESEHVEFILALGNPLVSIYIHEIGSSYVSKLDLECEEFLTCGDEDYDIKDYKQSVVETCNSLYNKYFDRLDKLKLFQITTDVCKLLSL